VTKAKMPVIMCPKFAAGQAASLGLWTARQNFGGTSTDVHTGGFAA